MQPVGGGNRKTLSYIKENHLSGLNIREHACRGKVFDWDLPPEWNIRDAYIADESGRKIVDFRKNNLHILGYSEPIDTKMPFRELDGHLYSLENEPDAVPYVTSYYKRRWGFCLTHRVREELRKRPDRIYHVKIDSDFNENGVINYGELVIEGQSDDEILISAYICHPSMANDNLSGIAAACLAAKHIYAIGKRKYTYRIIFIPETIGSLIYLKENIDNLQKRLKAGFVLSCMGDEGDYSCVHTPYNDTYADKIASCALKSLTGQPKEYSFLERGSDERQFCSPLAALPVCALSRTKFGKFRQYHTSEDNLDFVTPAGLEGGFKLIRNCIDILEKDGVYRVNNVGEPQLGKYGLYPTVSKKGGADGTTDITNLIAYLNGKNSLSDISVILGRDFSELAAIAEKLAEKGIITEIFPS